MLVDSSGLNRLFDKLADMRILIKQLGMLNTACGLTSVQRMDLNDARAFVIDAHGDIEIVRDTMRRWVERIVAELEHTEAPHE